VQEIFLCEPFSIAFRVSCCSIAPVLSEEDALASCWSDTGTISKVVVVVGVSVVDGDNGVWVIMVEKRWAEEMDLTIQRERGIIVEQRFYTL
jgi:hypothetical protein